MRVVGLSLSILTLVWTFRDADPDRVAALLGRVGAAGVLILIPQLASLFVEAVGWRLAFEGMGRRLSLWGLFRARLATEALAQTLPLGVVFCESMTPVLLARSCGADLGTSLAGIAARKWLLVGSQAIYVLSFTLLGWSALATVSTSLPIAALGAGGLLLFLTLCGYGLLARGKLAARAHAALSRLPWRWLRERLAPLGARFTQTDGQLESFAASALKSPLPLLAFLLGWLFEAAETWLILLLIGVPLSWTAAGAVEVTASFLRNVAFVVPAGLGVQDLGYVTFLRGVGVTDALSAAAAFSFLKRGKECAWAIVGYLVLLLELRASPVRSSVVARWVTNDASPLRG